MFDPARLMPADVPCPPRELILRWPTSLPLVMLHSGRLEARWARWTVAGAPAAWLRFDTRPHWLGTPTSCPISLDPSVSPITQLDRATAALAREAASAPSGWMGYLSYDLGRWVEPAAQHARGSRDDRGWPALELARCPLLLCFDHLEERWYALGDRAELQPLLTSLQHGPSRRMAPPTMTDLESSLAPDDYLDAARRVIESIAAGDIFQANLTQRFTTRFRGSSRAFAAAALAIAQPHYGAYLEMPGGRSIVSMSPELFLEVDGVSRRVVTRPIKGTRPASAVPAELAASAKDAAELNMITDLMRNDLGRVCEYGSVRVEVPRAIESHPTIHHGVSEVHGMLRPGTTIGDLLQATFPGGSITGAPKIRAMQIIDELEPVRRGPYCGSIGWIGDDGSLRLNIAIRTASLSGVRPGERWDQIDGMLDYGAGGGIVADSDPLSEYRECLDKTAVLRLAMDEARTCHLEC